MRIEGDSMQPHMNLQESRFVKACITGKEVNKSNVAIQVALEEEELGSEGPSTLCIHIFFLLPQKIVP